jgi:hypothetical protein
MVVARAISARYGPTFGTSKGLLRECKREREEQQYADGLI